MLNVTELCGFGAGGIEPVEGTFITSAIDTVDRTTYTFSGVSLGPVVSGRLIVVVISCGTIGGAVSSASIGGVSATVDNNGMLSIASALVPAGTTGDIVVTWSAGRTQTGISVYSLKNATTAAAEETVELSDTSPFNLSLASTKKGCAIIAGNGGYDATMTPSGFTEYVDTALESTANRYGNGMQNYNGAETKTLNYTISTGLYKYATSKFFTNE